VAGDWIKIECTTPDKPEIVQIASILKLDQDAVIGKCIRLWIWVDNQSLDGNGLTVTEPFLDRLTYCPGFATALRQVGWLLGREGRLTIPNFGRHNGQTAKNRALTKDRVKKTRSECNASTVTKTLPEIEKRREKSIKTQGEESVADAPASPDVLIRDDCSAPAAEIITTFDSAFGCRSLLTDKRKAALKARWKDPWWRDNWRAAIERGQSSGFLRGANDRNWAIDFEFFLKPDSVAKIVEGKYDNRSGAQSTLTANERREQVNACSFDRIRRAAAASSG